MVRLVKVRAVIWDGQRLFMVKNKKNGQAQSFWCLPGGNLDPNESITDCLKREIKEELGVEAEVGPLLYVNQFRVGQDEAIDFCFAVINWSAFLKLDLASTTHGLNEIAECGFFSPDRNDLRPEFLSKRPIGQDIAEATTRLFGLD